MALQTSVSSPVGTLYIAASSEGLQYVGWEKQPIPVTKSLASSTAAEKKIVEKTKQQLAEYFSGQRKTFNIPLCTVGTKFQKDVWNALYKIPFGQTCSYKDIAAKIKKSKAVRAVGSANGKNPICIIIPCHRVIAADGSLGGYSAGLKNKVKLLELERQQGK